MVLVQLQINGEKVQVYVSRVPCKGEKIYYIYPYLSNEGAYCSVTGIVTEVLHAAKATNESINVAAYLTVFWGEQKWCHEVQ